MTTNDNAESIRWRPIEDYFNGNYDWVLVRMYDGDYPCIPCVAEYRDFDHQWHMNDNNYSVLPFPVVEFADMQLIPPYEYYQHNNKYDPHILEVQLQIASEREVLPMMRKFNRMV